MTTALPAAIQKQLEEAEALQQQLAPQPATPAEPAPASEIEVVPQPDVAAEVPPDAPIAPAEDETFKQKYTILQAKYDAEVPRLHAQLREATGYINQLAVEVEALKTAKPVPTPEPDAPDNDAETFGEDLTSAIDRRASKKAQAMIDAAVAPFKEHIAKLEAKLGSMDEQVADTAYDRFLAGITAEVPDYQAINADQGFLRWLGEVDPVYGVPRQAALDSAAKALDSARAAAIFKAYKALTGKQAVDTDKQRRQQELARQVAPSGVRSSAPVTPAGKIWTAAEYEHAFDPRTIRSIGAEAATELQAQADLAYQEGRVQW